MTHGRLLTFPTGTGLLRHGLVLDQFPEKPSLVSTLRLPNVENSLLAYKLKVQTARCQGNLVSGANFLAVKLHRMATDMFCYL